MLKKIKVFVVDDSALMRKIISDMINSEIGMEVIGTARNGEELLSKMIRNEPDIITLDIEMPKMDGRTTLKKLKTANINIPVIMLSSSSKASTELTMMCLELGAFDFIAKPSGEISLDINMVKDELVEKIKFAYNQSKVRTIIPLEKKININKVIMQKNIERESKVVPSIDAVLIGASTGGPKALYKVITVLPDNIGVPVLVVQHMPTGFTKAFAQRLNLNSNLKVVEACAGDLIEKNIVYIAPGGYHMEVGRDKKIKLNTEPTIWGVRPAVDKLFDSATAVYGSHLLSVILTGMGRDGAKGTENIKDNGGITMSEHESTCTIYGMPKAAFETGKVDKVVLLENIAQEIIKVVMGR